MVTPERRHTVRRSEENGGLHERVSALEATLKFHMLDCVRRGKLLTKIGFFVASVVTATLGFLLKVHLFSS